MEKSDSTPYKILLVDDEIDLLDLLQIQLEMEGYVCITAPNGQEALEVYKHESPDLVISDFNMPVMNGGELLKSVKEHTPNASFILFLSEGGTMTTQEALDLGATTILEKPFSHEHLIKAVSEALKNPHLSEAG